MISNPIESYKQINRESDIRGSEPHRLILLLFQAIDAALVQALKSIAANDVGLKTSSLTKAVEIINDGLIASLNMNQGGEIAANLKALYDYMVSRLIHANFKNDTQAILEVQVLLEEIHSAWREIGANRNRNEIQGS